MGRPSKIDNHPDRRKIIKRLVLGDQFSDIVREYPDLTWDDLDYYAKNKLPEVLSKSDNLKAEIEGEQGNDTLADIKALKAKAIEILTEAQSTGDLKVALLAIREARGCLETILKAEGQIQEQSFNLNLQQTNIYASSEWLKVSSVLADVLAPYPELKAAVASKLLALSRGGA